MHEMNIARSLLDSVNNNPNIIERKSNGWVITKIIIMNGELSPVHTHDLEDALQNLRDIISCVFEITDVESEIECACGYVGRAKINERSHEAVVWSCPKCGRLYPAAKKGKDITVRQVVMAAPHHREDTDSISEESMNLE